MLQLKLYASNRGTCPLPNTKKNRIKNFGEIVNTLLRIQRSQVYKRYIIEVATTASIKHALGAADWV